MIQWELAESFVGSYAKALARLLEKIMKAHNVIVAALLRLLSTDNITGIAGIIIIIITVNDLIYYSTEYMMFKDKRLENIDTN